MRLGTIIAIVVALAGCGLVSIQTMQYKVEQETEVRKLEKAKEAVQNKEQEIQLRRAYPAPMARPAPNNNEPKGGGYPSIVENKEKTTEKTDVVTRQLFSASLAFVIPEIANINESIKAQLLINPNKDLKELEKELTRKGTVTSKEIKVSKVVKATIVAPDFEVSKVTEEEQILSDTQSTEWLWNLVPKTSGEHDVSLTVTAIITTNNKESKHHLKTFEKTVTIKITPTQVFIAWVTKYWQWIMSTLIIPFGIWLYKKKFS